MAGTLVIFVVMGLIGLVAFFLVMRELWLWYWKVDTALALLRQIRDQLHQNELQEQHMNTCLDRITAKLYGETTPTPAPPPGPPAAPPDRSSDPTRWGARCAKCGQHISNGAILCRSCEADGGGGYVPQGVGG